MSRRPICGFRTVKQIAADKLDLEVFRIVSQLDQFANDFRDDAVRQMARQAGSGIEVDEVSCHK